MSQRERTSRSVGGGPRLNPGMRRTRQRHLVWEALHQLGAHHTADDIVAQVRLRDTRFSRSTVYRALDAMLATGELTATRLDAGALRYELAPRPHPHAICNACGQVFHLDDLALQVAERELVGVYHFLPERADLTVRGVCQACRDRAAAHLGARG
ncbi:MAG: Fur family transcriptional regulator [Candidatus Dormibacteraceae bacterium]